MQTTLLLILLQSWFRSHFDFISADGRVLVEAKNYNAAVRNKFDTDS